MAWWNWMKRGGKPAAVRAKVDWGAVDWGTFRNNDLPTVSGDNPLAGLQVIPAVVFEQSWLLKALQRMKYAGGGRLYDQRDARTNAIFLPKTMKGHTDSGSALYVPGELLPSYIEVVQAFITAVEEEFSAAARDGGWLNGDAGQAPASAQEAARRIRGVVGFLTDALLYPPTKVRPKILRVHRDDIR
jgi:hypothetical protein